jgi:hypothetical protein
MCLNIEGNFITDFTISSFTVTVALTRTFLVMMLTTPYFCTLFNFLSLNF